MSRTDATSPTRSVASRQAPASRRFAMLRRSPQRAPVLSTSITGTATLTTTRETGSWRKKTMPAISATSNPAERKTARYSSLPAPTYRVA